MENSRLMTAQTAKINSDLLQKLIWFYTPRQFTKSSSQFDIGYEQCKRDLRHMLKTQITNLSDHENLEPEAIPAEKKAWWKLW